MTRLCKLIFNGNWESNHHCCAKISSWLNTKIFCDIHDKDDTVRKSWVCCTTPTTRTQRLQSAASSLDVHQLSYALVKTLCRIYNATIFVTARTARRSRFFFRKRFDWNRDHLCLWIALDNSMFWNSHSKLHEHQNLYSSEADGLCDSSFL